MAAPINPSDEVRILLRSIVRNVKISTPQGSVEVAIKKVFDESQTQGVVSPKTVLNRIRSWRAEYSRGNLKNNDVEFIKYIARAIRLREPRFILALTQPSVSEDKEQAQEEQATQKNLKKQQGEETARRKVGGKLMTQQTQQKETQEEVTKSEPYTEEQKTATQIFEEKYGRAPTKFAENSPLRQAFPKTTPPSIASPAPSGPSAAETFRQKYGKPPTAIPGRSILQQAFPKTTPPPTPSTNTPAQSTDQDQPMSPLQDADLPSRNRKPGLPFDPLRNLARNLAVKTAQRYLLIPGIIIGIVLFAVFYTFFEDLLWSSALLPVSTSESACFNQGGGSCPSAGEIDANSQDQNTCKFLNPGIDIFDSSKPAGLQAYIDKYKPSFVQNYLRNTGERQTEASSEFDRRLDYILTRSEQVGLNPILFLALWKSENDFSLRGDSVYHMGCMAGSLDFYSQVDCATGIGDIDSSLGEKNSRGETIGSFSSRCASPKNPNSAAACAVLESIRTSHPDIYPNDHAVSPFNNPIQTFDEWEESFGPHSPILNRPKTSTNNNCIHSYNLHIQIAELAGACKQGPANASSTPNNLSSNTTDTDSLSGQAIKREQIGTSAGGAPIYVYKLGGGSKTVAIVGGMNGSQEQAGIDTVNAAKNAFEQNTDYQVPEGTTLYFIPEITPASNGKGFNANGQDVNRNFDSTSVPGAKWSQLGCSVARYAGDDIPAADKTAMSNCSDSAEYFGKTKAEWFPEFCSAMTSGENFTCARNKTGSAAFSEPETQAIVKFIKDKQIQTVLSYRAPRNEITTSNAPVGDKLPGADQLANLISQEVGKPYTPYFVSYPVPGQFMDWLQDQGVVGVEIEIQNGEGSAKHISSVQKALDCIASGNCTTGSRVGSDSVSCVQSGNIGKFQYFCQGTPSSWASYPYACENMAFAGCGPTSMAMVLATFGNNVTPQTVAKDFTDNGWDVCNGGTNMLGILSGSAGSSPREYLRSKGVAVGTSIMSGGGIDLQAAKAAIDAGAFIIASGNPFPSCNCGHIVVIDNIDVVAKTVHVQDPICSRKYTENTYPANPAGWSWNYVFPISKI